MVKKKDSSATKGTRRKGKLQKIDVMKELISYNNSDENPKRMIRNQVQWNHFVYEVGVKDDLT